MTEELPFCECGCGERVAKKGNRFITGHNRRGKVNSLEHNAAISRSHIGITLPPRTPEHSAAISLARRNSDAVKAHNESMCDVPRSQETCDAISATHKDVPLSPEHIAAISEGLKNSDANKAQAESMCGGNDLVNHHYIYDHSDLSKNTVKMTRKDHSRLHKLLQKLGYIVAHTNVKEMK